MPIQIEQRQKSLDVDLCRPSDDPQVRWAVYPYPPLTVEGQSEVRVFEVLHMDTPFLSAEIVPALGGRTISLTDKRTGTDVFDPANLLQAHKRGPRRFELSGGLEIGVGNGCRPNAMGPVDVQASDEEIVWHERILGTGLSFHTVVTGVEDRAELMVEVRVFNRWLTPQAYAGWFSAGIDGQTGANWAYDERRQAGLVVGFPKGMLGPWAPRPSRAAWGRFGEGICEWLAPRQLDTWAFRLFPVSGLRRIDGASEFGAVCVQEEGFEIVAFRSVEGAKVYVKTTQGETLASTINFDPSKPVRVSLGAQAILVRDPQGEELLQWPQAPPPAPSALKPVGSVAMAALRSAQIEPGPSRESHYFDAVDKLSEGKDPTEDLALSSFVPLLRAPSHTVQGCWHLQRSEWLEAARCFDSALQYNPDDHLSWWHKALALRLAGEPGEDEMPNAHYLAPLEPVLRAEAFLSQPHDGNPDPSPIVAPLANDVESLVEIACLLIESRLFEQAARWIDEALRHCKDARLHHLLAYCHLEGTKLTLETAQQVKAARDCENEWSKPWQPVELRALKRLSEVFEGDIGLAQRSENATMMMKGRL